jgi:phosphoserine phosphatase
MTTPHWQLQTPIQAVVFDCDGTLSAIEGVNELARYNGVYDEVEHLTTQAMSKIGINPDLYQKRLQLIAPRVSQVETLAQHYFDHLVTDVIEIIAVLQRLSKAIYLVSAGVNPAVLLFGERLKIPKAHIYAVNLHFDQEGKYVDYDRASPLVYNDGKRHIVRELMSQHSEVIHIGDGLNDFSTHDMVKRFIGYGGVYYRDVMKKNCKYYIETLSLSPLLPLCLTQNEVSSLTKNELTLYQKGVQAIESHQVTV